MTTSVRTIRIVIDSTAAQASQNALNSTINNTTRNTTNLNNSVNTTNRTVNNLDQSINTTNRTINRYVTNIRQATDATNQQAFATNKLAAFIKGYITVLAGANAVKGIAAIGDEYAKITGLLRNATNSQEEFNTALAFSKQVAEETRAPLAATVETFAALNRVTQGTGKTQKELFGILETINKSIALTSPNATSAAAALTQFGQALGGDFKAGSQELNSILEQAPGLAEAVAKGLGVPTKALKKMGEEGKLSTELVLTALTAVASEIDEKFSKIPKTVSAATTEIKNDLLTTFGDANVTAPLIESIEDLGETLKDPAVKDGLVTISSFLVTIVSWGLKAAGMFGELGKNIGYFIAQISGNVSELDKLEKEIQNLSRNDFISNLNEKFAFRSKEDTQKLIAEKKARIAAIYEEQGIYVQTEEEKAKIAKDKKISDGIDAVFEKEATIAKVEELKRTNEQIKLDKEAAKEKEKKRKEIEREIENLKELLNTKGQSKQVEIRYKLEILGASPAEVEAAVAMAKQLDDREAQKKIQKATETTSDEVANAKSVTKQLEIELQTRQQVSDFYREARLAKDKGKFEVQRATLKAQESEKFAALDQQEAENAQKRADQLRKALDHENLTESQKLEIRIAYRNQELADEATFEEQKNAIREQGVRTREEIDKLEYMSRLASFGALGGALMSLGEGQSRKVFETGKALALAQAAISLPSAVIESFKNSGGMPWGLPAAGAMLATGLKNIQMIKSAKFGGGANAGASVGSGGGSGGLPTTNSASGNEEAFKQKQVIEIRGIGPDSLITGSQLAEILGRDDNVIVALQGAQQDAQRRGVI